MIATLPAGIPAEAWAELSETERAALATECAAKDNAEQWAAAEHGTARLDWPELYRAIRAMGGINGLGQIAQSDIPGGLGVARDARGRLLTPRAAVPYDELPLALAGAGFGDRITSMTGDELLVELWAAWDAWDAHQAAGRPAAEVAPIVAPVAQGPALGQPETSTVVAAAAARVGSVTPAPSRTATAGRPADVAPLPEPDAADVEAYAVADAIAPLSTRSQADRPTVTHRAPHARPPSARQRQRWRDLDELDALELAHEDLAREERERRARVARVEPAQREGRRPRLHLVAPEPAEPEVSSARARTLMVAALLGGIAWSVGGLVALVAALTGADVPGALWLLALALPAVSAGTLPVVLPGRRAPIERMPAARPAGTESQWRFTA